MTKYLLSVDPGKLQCGVAIFSGNVLVSATLARNPTDKPGSDGPGVWANTANAVLNSIDGHIPPLVDPHLVLEIPVIRPQGRQKGRQEDVICLAGVDGAIAALFDCPVSHYKPEQWKGTVDGDTMTKRILGAGGLKHCGFKLGEFDHKLQTRLSQTELNAIDLKVPKSLLHNVIDGIGLGLFYLGRMS